MTTINSKRLFTVAFLESNFTYSNPAVCLETIFDTKDDEEWKYSVQENIDDVLDLKIGERLRMCFNRDNKDSEGFIKRVK